MLREVVNIVFAVSPSMSSDAQRQRPRQDPVSCDSCRKKKLKCDREIPCANCTSRSVPCEYQGRRPPAAASSPDTEEVKALRRENAAIKARIDRLEELVYSGSSSIDPEARPSKVRRLVDDKSAKALVSPSTNLTDSPRSELTKNYSRDVQWLEGVGKCPLPDIDTLLSSILIARLNRHTREHKAATIIYAVFDTCCATTTHHR